MWIMGVYERIVQMLHRGRKHWEDGPQGLKRALSEASSRVALNGTGMAVQVTGCSGDIVAHFPLTEDQLAVLPG